MVAVDRLPLISLTDNDELVQKACDAVMVAFPIKPPYESATFKRMPRTGGFIQDDMLAFARGSFVGFSRVHYVESFTLGDMYLSHKYNLSCA